MSAAVRRVLEVGALVAVLAVLGWCLAFRLGGGHWERIETPSMGTTAPVGTLLWVGPVDRVQVGEIVTFHKPDVAVGPVYSHRVTEVAADGSFSTAGDLSGDDPWVVQPDDVIGRAVHVWPRVGWLVLAAPVLAVGAVVTAGLILLTRRQARLPLVVLGASVTLAVVLVVHQPLSGALLLGVQHDGEQTTASYVATGLLPIDVTAPGGSSVRLSSGEDGAVTVPPDADGRVEVDVSTHVPWWFWLTLLLGCFSPALGSVVVGSSAPVGGARRLEPAPAT